MNATKNSTKEMRRFLTIKEFCNEARIGGTTLHRHMKNGLVPFTKIGSRVLISSSIIEQLATEAKEGKE